jgi:hypothetical protein
LRLRDRHLSELLQTAQHPRATMQFVWRPSNFPKTGQTSRETVPVDVQLAGVSHRYQARIRYTNFDTHLR